MNRTFTCILCPKGCSLHIDYTHETKEIKTITGAGCKKGDPWARQELLSPVRTLCTSMRVIGGEDPLVSVKSDREITLESIPSVMQVITSSAVHAPIDIDDVVLENPAGVSCRILATRRNNEHRKD